MPYISNLNNLHELLQKLEHTETQADEPKIINTFQSHKCFLKRANGLFVHQTWGCLSSNVTSFSSFQHFEIAFCFFFFFLVYCSNECFCPLEY